ALALLVLLVDGLANGRDVALQHLLGDRAMLGRQFGEHGVAVRAPRTQALRLRLGRFLRLRTRWPALARGLRTAWRRVAWLRVARWSPLPRWLAFARRVGPIVTGLAVTPVAPVAVVATVTRSATFALAVAAALALADQGRRHEVVVALGATDQL